MLPMLLRYPPIHSMLKYGNVFYPTNNLQYYPNVMHVSLVLRYSTDVEMGWGK